MSGRRMDKPARERILEAAADLFAAASAADDVTMEAIAAQAHVSKATLYRYFDGKENLLAAVVEAGFDVAHLSPRDRQSQILEAALRLFGRQGYHATTMDQIAKAVGLTKGAIYWYFKSKEDLIEPLIAHYSAIPDAERLTSASLDCDPEVVLTGFATRLLDVAQARIDAVRVAICEGQRFPEVRELVAREIFGRLLPSVGQFLQVRAEAGMFRPGNPTLQAWILLSNLVMFALVEPILSQQFPFSDEEMVRGIVRTFLDGIRQPSPKAVEGRMDDKEEAQ